ncbi:TPA: hypothetical protein HA278_06560 [Candidatus Woesearchaeota archaeon]|nr:hypothetical protein [archaeon]HIJ11694.1 hypothetical protein [Candidatus Woesearchaeota archaeon]
MFEKKRDVPHLVRRELPSYADMVHDDLGAVQHKLTSLREKWAMEDIYIPRIRKPVKEIPRLKRPIRLQKPAQLEEWNTKLERVNLKLAQLHSTTQEEKLQHAITELELIQEL